jgi:hypothetical protein
MTKKLLWHSLLILCACIMWALPSTTACPYDGIVAPYVRVGVDQTGQQVCIYGHDVGLRGYHEIAVACQ